MHFFKVKGRNYVFSQITAKKDTPIIVKNDTPCVSIS